MSSLPIDADNHYYEPLDAFTRYLEPAFRDRGVKSFRVASIRSSGDRSRKGGHRALLAGCTTAAQAGRGAASSTHERSVRLRPTRAISGSAALSSAFNIEYDI